MSCCIAFVDNNLRGLTLQFFKEFSVKFILKAMRAMMNEEVCSRESLEQANSVLIQNIMWIHESVET